MPLDPAAGFEIGKKQMRLTAKTRRVPSRQLSLAETRRKGFFVLGFLGDSAALREKPLLLLLLAEVSQKA